MDIRTLLDSYNSNMLWEMARQAQLSGTTGKKLKKAQLLKLMQQEFFQPERIKASYQQLTDKEKSLINRLLLHGGTISTRLFKWELVRAKLTEEAPPQPKPPGVSTYEYQRGWSVYGRTVNHVGTPHDPQSPIFEDMIARLTLFGLVFSTEVKINSGGQAFKLQFHPAAKLIIPRFVSQYLPAPEPLPVEENNWQPTHVMQGNPQRLLRDLYLYWDTARQNSIPLIKSGLVSKRGMKQLNENLLTPDPSLKHARSEEDTTRLFLLRQILQTLDLVQAQAGELHTTSKNTLSIPKFWQDDTVKQVNAVVAAWRMLYKPVHLDYKGSYSYYFTPNTQTGCQYLLKILAEFPAATWLNAETLLVSLQEQNLDFLIADRSRIEQQRSYYYYENTAELMAEMDQLEKQFVAQLMAGFLFEAGLVELGFDEPTSTPEQWSAFRLTPLGTAVFKDMPMTSPPATGQIILQPNFQILAMGPVPLNQLAQLDLFAERQKVDRNAFEYHLSRESVYAAQQAGYAVAEIERFLTAVTPNGLPQNIQRSLSEWAAHHERIVFRSGVTLLQANDEALLKQLLAQPDTSKHLARPAGETVALVKTNRQTQLIKALQTSGVFPAVSGANPQSADKSVIVNEDGHIEPVHAVPSLYLRGRLARFTDEGQHGWQLTETAVSRAGGSKRKAQAIIDELKKLHRGQLPQSVVVQVKAWGGYYGNATTGTLTLFEFRDQETLAELAKLPELKSLLKPFAAGKRALAVVTEADVTAVVDILVGLGVKVSQMTIS